jgi:hypothetical protein
MTPTVTNEVRVAAIRSMLMDAENQIRKCNKILDFMMDGKTADETTTEYLKAQDECED